MTAPNITEGRMIFKVLVIGNDLPLQTGFLSGASGDRVSCKLYNALGLSLGVVKREYSENLSVVLQLWSIPFTERLVGLSKTFTKGHRAIILVVRPHEISIIPEIFDRLVLSQKTPLLIVIVGSVRDAEIGTSHLETYLGSHVPVQAVQSIDEVVELLAGGLLPRSFRRTLFPMIVALPDEIGLTYEPTIPEITPPPNSEEEINEIRGIATDLGLRIIGNSCAIELPEGVAWVCMRTGNIRMEPEICWYCTHGCKRFSNICIVATDAGWLSTNHGSRALLTVAKIYSLSARILPTHARKQIERISLCMHFKPDPSIPIEEIPDEILTGSKTTDSGKSLLEAARQRVKEGKLTRDVFSMLKKKLHNIESSYSQ